MNGHLECLQYTQNNGQTQNQYFHYLSQRDRLRHMEWSLMMACFQQQDVTVSRAAECIGERPRCDATGLGDCGGWPDEYTQEQTDRRDPHRPILLLRHDELGAHGLVLPRRLTIPALETLLVVDLPSLKGDGFGLTSLCADLAVRAEASAPRPRGSVVVR